MRSFKCLNVLHLYSTFTFYLKEAICLSDYITREQELQAQETSEFSSLFDNVEDQRDLARFFELSSYNNFQDYTEADKQEIIKTRLILRSYLPLSFDKLDLGTIKIMTSSILHLDDKRIFEDYTYILYPTLKAIEAVMLQIISGLHITTERRFKIGWLFYDRYANDPEALSDFALSPSCRYYNAIPESYHEPLEGLYNLLHRYRHYYFHANKNTDGEISYIATRAFAVDLLMDIYAEIERSAAVL